MRARGRQQRVDEREHPGVAGREAVAAVEAEPAEPQQAGPDQHVDRVAGAGSPGAHGPCAPTTSAAARAEKPEPILDRDAACEVERAARLQPAAAERPVREHGVDAKALLDHSPANTRNGPKRMRSTTAPATSAVVTMQNVAWKAMNSMCGIVVPSRGSKPTPLRNAVTETADEPTVAIEGQEYPMTAHEIAATASAATHIMNVFRVFSVSDEAGVEEAERRRQQHQRGGGKTQAVSPTFTSGDITHPPG